ncbi:hypothetical protein FR483_n443R [Paramecium bursaria Chlorella virus FR483]|uniref:Uncharacterized protein n443R n=1 Tax=Paramecium bursaria Chlorella virus FR483 TaxID=399781 RepID=A7J7E7_PBCVF|nr:hypothetical protein FR483_n443R [Paramecium bursaria Chlorella virus FR483]ABT15728.1 hypothetical protein FR483_n443R [Paramecium bursaria Chlorella virus FR483]
MASITSVKVSRVDTSFDVFTRCISSAFMQYLVSVGAPLIILLITSSFTRPFEILVSIENRSFGGPK